MIDQDMASKVWAMGNSFTMADCAAAPALFYTDKVMPLGESYPNAARYLARLMDRPPFGRAIDKARPYLDRFPALT